MTPYSYTIPKASHIVVTYHAQKRFTERFRLYFSNLKLSSKSLWDNVIAAQVSTGRVCYKWEMCPFYVNKIKTRYGKVFVIKKNPCYYVVKEKGNKLIVITVVPRWFED